MRILQRRKLYLPALSIVAVVVLLLGFIGISTYRNLDMNRKNAGAFVRRQGLAMLQVMEAGARAGMLSSRWEADVVARLIEETAKSPDIAYIYLADREGRYLHHSDPALEGRTSDGRLPIRTSAGTTEDGDPMLAEHLGKLPDGTSVYELSKRFTPFPREMLPAMCPFNGSELCHRWVAQNAGVRLAIGLRMTAFEAARRADIRHAVVMAVILVALGSGALFFIFVIQNYYLVDRTLQQTRDYTRQVVDHMANGLVSIDAGGMVLSHNTLALELLGLADAEIEGVNLGRIIDFDAAGVRKTLTSGKPVMDREILRQDRSGETIPLALSSTPLTNNAGSITGAVILLRDLREIKRLEAQVRRSEKLAAVGKLAAAVAHEIRNPLSSIRGFAQFLGHILKDHPRDREYAAVMVKEVDRINRVVTDLLTFARPQNAEAEAVDLKELVDHVLRLIEGDAREGNVMVGRRLPSIASQPVLDGGQITQALLNLCLNALQAMNGGGVLNIGAETDERGGLMLWVEDDGPGISPEFQARIFDPFFTTRDKGTGLGLAIVQKIAENHNGGIRIESPPPGKQRGCRFIISIPGAIPEDARDR
ncbi:two-component system sensor histidine kinase NtrB [Desulfococcus sp.]|uniref:two-component system sensor histidine kinase NtrB n=1 Tax=Desulfococcus sp. TaxID=2025834 RepID=UPI003D0AB04B